jgi:uncharacterized protein YegJ (DUF2314 family)
MKALLLRHTALWMIATGMLGACSKESPQDKVINVDGQDAEMNRAIATAREKLPVFWEKFEKRTDGETDFNLKVEISDSNGSEHFWVSDLAREDGKLFGKINNDPMTVKNVKLGERIGIAEKDISDWLYLRKDGKMVGNYTVRALFPQMPKAEVDQLKERLAEP